MSSSNKNTVPTEETVTDRKRERGYEEEHFIPVIVKRTDEYCRHPDDILEYAVEAGLRQLNRPGFSLFLSALAAGLILGFSVMVVAIVSDAMLHAQLESYSRLAAATVYPLGFVICMMSGTELFTEHTATAVYPVLDRRASFLSLLRLWSIVVSGNLAGTVISAALLSAGDQVIQAHDGYVYVGEHLIAFDFPSLFLSAVLAGWLMAQGAWLLLSTLPTVGQIVSIYIVTFIIGVGGLHHSIAGAAEVFTAAFVSDTISISDIAFFLCVALPGNLVGGSVFVALLNYAHVRKTQAKELT